MIVLKWFFFCVCVCMWLLLFNCEAGAFEKGWIWKGEKESGLAVLPFFVLIFNEMPIIKIYFPCVSSWASLGAQSVKNLPATQEACVCSLGWKNPLEEEMATHSSILTWRIPWKGTLACYSPWGCKSRTDLATKPPTTTSLISKSCRFYPDTSFYLPRQVLPVLYLYSFQTHAAF